jgi:O-antigen/teichoic acid export membrane protein
MFAEIKRLFKHTSVYSIGTIAQRSVAFLLLPIYTRYITPSDYGILEILVVTGQILSIFYSLAMYSGFSRTFLCDCKDEVDKKETLATALVFVLLFSAFMLIVTFCFINPLNNLLFKGEDYTAYIKIILLTCFLSTLAVIPSAYLVATEKSLIFIIISFIQTLFNLSINIYLVAFLRLGIKGIILGNLLAQGSAGAILTTIFLLKIGITIKIYCLTYDRFLFSFFYIGYV